MHFTCDICVYFAEGSKKRILKIRRVVFFPNIFCCLINCARMLSIQSPNWSSSLPRHSNVRQWQWLDQFPCRMMLAVRTSHAKVCGFDSIKASCLCERQVLYKPDIASEDFGIQILSKQFLLNATCRTLMARKFILTIIFYEQRKFKKPNIFVHVYLQPHYAYILTRLSKSSQYEITFFCTCNINFYIIGG